MCFGFGNGSGGGGDYNNAHPIERLARRDLSHQKVQLRKSSLAISRERTKTVNTARAEYARTGNKQSIRALASAIVDADKQLERNALLIAKLEICLARLRRARAHRRMARSVETAAVTMRFINAQLRSVDEFRELAAQMQRQMMRYTDIQEYIDSALDTAISESPLATTTAPDVDETIEADDEAERVLQEVLRSTKSPMPLTKQMHADQARVELVMAQLTKQHLDYGNDDDGGGASQKKNRGTRDRRPPNALQRAVGLRSGSYARLDDGSSNGGGGGDVDDSGKRAAVVVEVEMQDMSLPPPPSSSPPPPPRTAAADAAVAAEM